VVYRVVRASAALPISSTSLTIISYRRKRMLTRATDFRVNFRESPTSKPKSSPAELELWLERSLRDRARTAKRGSHARLAVFIEMLELISAADPVFGCFLDRILIDIRAEQDCGDPPVPALQRLLSQEDKLAQLKREIEIVADENEQLAKQLAEVQTHVRRRQSEMKELEAVLRQKSSVFEEQRHLNASLNELFKMFDEPIVVKDEAKVADAPQILSLKLHNESLEEQKKGLQKMMELAEAEIEMIQQMR
jgi:hypothetical protein